MRCENETISGIGVADVQKLSFMRFPTCPRDPVGIAVVDVQKLRGFAMIATLCEDQRGRGAQTRGCFLRFQLCARPSAWIGRVKSLSCESSWFTSAGIVRVRSLSLWSRVNLRGLRATVCKDQAAKSQLLSTKVVREVRPRGSGNF